MSELAALLERVKAATGPDPELAVDINIALDIASYITDDGDPTESIDAAIALLGTVLPGWWWTCGDCALTHDAAIAIPGSNGIGLGNAIHAIIGPDFRASEEMQTLLRQRPDLDGGVDVARVGGSVPLAIVEAILQALISLRQSERERRAAA